MAWLERRGSGYLVRWRDIQGQKKQRLFRLENDARDFARTRTRDYGADPGERVTLEDYLHTTLGAAEDLRESTRYHYVSMARKHIGPAIGHLALADLTAGDIREFLARMREAGYSDSYRAIARNVLGRTITLAV